MRKIVDDEKPINRPSIGKVLRGEARRARFQSTICPFKGLPGENDGTI